MNRIEKGMEINTAMIMYKTLIRSISDYGSIVFPRIRGSKR